MTVANAAAAERGAIPISSRSVNAKVQTLQHYTDHPDFSTQDLSIWPFEHISVGLALAAERIVRKWPVSRPVARAYAELNGLGGRA